MFALEELRGESCETVLAARRSHSASCPLYNSPTSCAGAQRAALRKAFVVHHRNLPALVDAVPWQASSLLSAKAKRLSDSALYSLPACLQEQAGDQRRCFLTRMRCCFRRHQLQSPGCCETQTHRGGRAFADNLDARRDIACIGMSTTCRSPHPTTRHRVSSAPQLGASYATKSMSSTTAWGFPF